MASLSNHHSQAIYYTDITAGTDTGFSFIWWIKIERFLMLEYSNVEWILLDKRIFEVSTDLTYLRNRKSWLVPCHLFQQRIAHLSYLLANLWYNWNRVYWAQNRRTHRVQNPNASSWRQRTFDNVLNAGMVICPLDGIPQEVPGQIRW